MKAIIIDNGVVLLDDIQYPISKYQKSFHDKIGLEVNVTLYLENPDTCGIYCNGDETCTLCYKPTASIIDNESIIREYKIDKINGY